MKIVLFTSESMGAANELNIASLMKAKKDFEYVYVVVKQNQKSRISQLKFSLKKIILGIKTDWYRDNNKVEKLLQKEVQKFPKYDSPTYFVNGVNSLETEETIKKLNPDLIIQCGAGILKENIFSIPKNGTLNVHHGIAPELRGIASTFWGMYYGLNECIGTTVHFIDEHLDTGVVISQKPTKTNKNSTYIETSFQTVLQGANLLPNAIDLISSGYQTDQKEVDSKYCSRVHYSQYNALKKNNFQKVKNFDDSKIKTKVKSKIITAS